MFLKHLALIIALFSSTIVLSQVQLCKGIKIRIPNINSTAIPSDSTKAKTTHYIEGNVTESDPKSMVIMFPDVDPSFPGGRDSLARYIAAHFDYSSRKFKKALKKSDQPFMWMKFVVDKNGDLSKFTPRFGLSEKINEEFKRILSGTQWRPGELDGKKADHMVMVQISFIED